jgi:hypothetical protein
MSRGDVKARSAGLKLKKRRVQGVTRLPTERLATACWKSIVAKRTSREPAPMLDFRPLRVSDKESYPQIIHMLELALGACGEATTRARRAG